MTIPLMVSMQKWKIENTILDYNHYKQMMESRIASEERMRHETEKEITKLREELRRANQTVKTLQTERKHLDNELKAMKEESARFIKDQNKISDLRKQHATLKDEYEQALKSMKAMGIISTQLAESEKSARMLEHQLEFTLLEKNELSDQLQAANAQLQIYQRDFETERKDREMAHSKLADQERTIAQLKVQEDCAKKCYEKQLAQHQESVSAIEQVNEKLHQAVQLERVKCQKLEQEMLTKSSQVKQYSKEKERLKQQLSAIQGVENHSSRAHSLPDKSESVAGLTKLNDLYRTANEQLSTKNSELCDQVERLERISAQLRDKLSFQSSQVQENECGQPVQNGVFPEGLPQAMLFNQNGNQGRTPSQVQEANSFNSELALSTPPQLVPYTHHAALSSQSPPRQFLSPEMLPDISTQQLIAGVHGSHPPISSATQTKSPKQTNSKLDVKGEVEKMGTNSSTASQLPPEPVGSLSQIDVRSDGANLEDSAAHFENPLQKEVDDEIHHQAAEVIQEVNGGRRDIKTDLQRPFDPNLICPMCRKNFRIGEIQKFKKHVDTCTGSGSH